MSSLTRRLTGDVCIAEKGPGGDKQAERPALAVADGMQLRVHAAFGPAPLGTLLRNALPGKGSGVHCPAVETQFR